MKYVSLDIKTTGLDPRGSLIIEFAMVLEVVQRDLVPMRELPHHVVQFSYPNLIGEWAALQRNWRLLHETQEDGEKDHVAAWERVVEILGQWGFSEKNKATVAGKNVAGFDMKFIPEEVKALFDHRCIDPGSTNIDWSLDKLPGLASLLGREPWHRALNDALDVIEVLRRDYG